MLLCFVMEPSAFAARSAATLYLELLKKCLTRTLFPDRKISSDPSGTAEFCPEERAEGKDWPTEAETMVGMRRLDNLEACIVGVIENKVPGDLVETGVWRGGAAILMRAVLKAYSDLGRRVWVADSFQGLPPPDPERYPNDAGDLHHTSPYLAVPLEEVKRNFSRYGLLDEQVCFLPGWFKTTLPAAPINQIAVLRLDGDMYESTMEALLYLYDKVSQAGFVIIDDYGALPNCRAAVEDFRRSRSITEPMQHIDWTGVFWRKGERHSMSSHWWKRRMSGSWLRSRSIMAQSIRRGRRSIESGRSGMR
jgi:O-methyltransferase